MASSSYSNKMRNSCSFLNLLLSLLNFILFILSAASLAPIISLRIPPTSLGIAFILVSTISILSAFIGFYSQFCCIFHLSLALASLIGQFFSILALYTKEKSSIMRFKSPRDPKEAMVLVRVECGVLMAMFMMQLGTLVLSCAVHSCWVRDYKGLEAEREMTEAKRRVKIARGKEESLDNEAKNVELKGKENKYGYLNGDCQV